MVRAEHASRFKEISTRRLSGTPIEANHFTEIRALHTDPRVMAMLSANGNTFEEQSHAFLQRAAEHWLLHGFGLWIFHLSAGAFVGYAGIKHAVVEGKDEVELAYAVSSAHWSNGLATEMSEAALKVGFQDLRIERIVAFTLSHNLASRSVMEHCGFTYQRDIVHAGLPHVLYRLDSATYAARANL